MYKLKLKLFLTYLSTIVLTLSTFKQTFCLARHPDIDLSIVQTERITKNGYPVETHTILTEDNYLLTTYRIPHGTKSRKTNKNPIVFFHGLGGSSENFIVLGKNEAIAYYLAERGYDIWLCNVRGTFHSRKHVTLNPDKDKEYWDFSYHEIAIYDIPGNIEHVLKITNQTSLFYIGHSQGSTLYFVLLSERPEYNKKIKLGIVMGPTAEFQFQKAPIIIIGASMQKGLETLFKKWNIYEILPNSPELSQSLKEMCTASIGIKYLCYHLFLLIPGLDSGLLNKTLVEVILSTAPAGISVKNAIHYGQGLDTGYFRQYDYGSSENLKRYNNTIPPAYSLSNVKTPTAIFHAALDWFAPTDAVDKLLKKLPNVILNYEVPYKLFNHVDFIFGNNATELVYKPIYNLLEKYKTPNHADTQPPR